MPAFSYKERFVPLIKGFTKTQTIRAFRKYLVKVGQMSYHYFGMRTKFCTELIPPQKIIKVQTIFLFKDGDVYLSDNAYTKREAYAMLKSKRKVAGRAKKLDAFMKDYLAWKDGFRDEKGKDGLSENGPHLYSGCFEKMIRFWRQTHELPFAGQLIKWK